VAVRVEVDSGITLPVSALSQPRLFSNSRSLGGVVSLLARA